jgi:transposase
MQDGDITMPELASALHDATGVRAHQNALGKFLRNFGYTHRKSHWSPPNAAKP